MYIEIAKTNIKIASIITSTINSLLGRTQANLLVVDETIKDPLIARKLEVWQYVGIIILAASLVVLVRVISPKVEHAILFAVFLSIALIIFFFTG